MDAIRQTAALPCKEKDCFHFGIILIDAVFPTMRKRSSVVPGPYFEVAFLEWLEMYKQINEPFYWKVFYSRLVWLPVVTKYYTELWSTDASLFA